MNQSAQEEYTKFSKINGSHPLKKRVSNFYVGYDARLRKKPKLTYFNFKLAKEMGLISKDHPDKMNSKLEKVILDTFAIIIINEYDLKAGKKFKQEDIKANDYMATRYLQLQHSDKKGSTSGDGRSIWNGQFRNRSKTWDISSCGTGATKLSPATSKYNRYFESGDPTISYGCGYAEIEEGLAAAVFSEVFYKNDIPTERTLALISFEKNFSVNVRVHDCLLRPSHFFVHLKQGNIDSLKSLIDYYIEQQVSNKKWVNCPEGNDKYDFFLEQITIVFAKTVAIFESEYIFCWLDWDGDNILMDGGIIDYGSVRQFGLFHYEYRYDDVERFSTNILEQKEKAKYIVQTFIQAVETVKLGEKKSINDFKKHKMLKRFEELFDAEKSKYLLNKLGFSQDETDFLLLNKKKDVQSFKRVFYYFERAKSKRGMIEVSDGITWDAIFCMRDLLRELPQLYISRNEAITEDEFISILKSSYASEKDVELTPYRKKMIKEFQSYYWKLVKSIARKFDYKTQDILLSMNLRSSVINKFERVTGDSITYIVEEILKKKKELDVDKLFRLIDVFASSQDLEPSHMEVLSKKEISKTNKKLLDKFFKIITENREGL